MPHMLSNSTIRNIPVYIVYIYFLLKIHTLLQHSPIQGGNVLGNFYLGSVWGVKRKPYTTCLWHTTIKPQLTTIYFLFNVIYIPYLYMCASGWRYVLTFIHWDILHYIIISSILIIVPYYFNLRSILWIFDVKHLYWPYLLAASYNKEIGRRCDFSFLESSTVMILNFASLEC